MNLIYIPVALVSILYLLYKYITRHENYWKDRNVPYVKPIPFFGNLKESVLRRKAIFSIIQDLYNQFPNEKVVGVFRMTTPGLLIRDLDIIKHVMIKDFDAFVDRGFELSQEGLGQNLFNADGDTWKLLRNKFTPIFTSGKLKNMLYLMTDRGDRFIKYVDDIVAKESEQEVHTLVQKYTLSAISACAFGIDIDAQRDKMEELDLINQKVFTLTYLNELDMLFPGIMRKINISIVPKVITNFFYNLVETILAQRNGVPSGRKDFMDLLLELKQQKNLEGTTRHGNEKFTLDITDSVMAAQAFVFYVAGYETSATTMGFLLYQLALHPEIQDKVHKEIDVTLAKYNGEITYDSLKEMTYLSQVFDETLRMFPLVEPLQRCAKVDYKVPGTNVTVKKGQIVWVSCLGIHYDEKYYKNPEKFDPDRFSPENSKDRHSCAYMPFGVGPRNCIGMRFAKVQSQVCITKLLSKFRVEPSVNTKRKIEYHPMRPIVNASDGILLNIVPRQK